MHYKQFDRMIIKLLTYNIYVYMTLKTHKAIEENNTEMVTNLNWAQLSHFLFPL